MIPILFRWTRGSLLLLLIAMAFLFATCEFADARPRSRNVQVFRSRGVGARPANVQVFDLNGRPCHGNVNGASVFFIR